MSDRLTDREREALVALGLGTGTESEEGLVFGWDVSNTRYDRPVYVIIVVDEGKYKVLAGEIGDGEFGRSALRALRESLRNAA